MKKMFKILTAVIVILCFGFTLGDRGRYVKVDDNIYSENDKDGNPVKLDIYNAGGGLAVYAIKSFTNVMYTNMNNKKAQLQLENDRAQAAAKSVFVKNQYNQITTFPETIIDGWHSVIATDGIGFCKDAKVYVKSNKIKKFVINNYIPVQFISTGEIKKAKNIITLTGVEAEKMNIVEVYFLYDIEEQVIVSEPIKPGYVCFWTSHKRPSDIHLKMNGEYVEKMTGVFKDEPKPFEKGTLSRIFPPGQYTYSWVGKGPAKGKGNFEIKEGECYLLELR